MSIRIKKACTTKVIIESFRKSRIRRKKAHKKTAKNRQIKTKKMKNKTKSRCRPGSDHEFGALWYNIIRKGEQTGPPSGGQFNIEIKIPGFEYLITDAEMHFS